ncbi:PI-PLC X domain-containing 1 [Hyphodiscus hymeniophilus]|uniref:PI-PLC X domain-containing 1 n=1 Tax=Hyphodiscus hymeniophilus TaxID=353542 RepID=A0A9P6VDR6_9HELO|nr:PI-PLC X domain-containing 1 [Hyphodiscus hymeniophilus]
MGNSGSSASTTDVACNGNVALCSRLYSNVTQIGTHDSAFVGILPTDNQLVSVTTQLDDGVRFLQAQTHVKDNVLELCHTSCAELDAGPLTTYLTDIKTWLDANDNQVLTLLLTNGDFVDVSMFGDAMTSSGLSSYAFTPGTQLSMSQWPTLQQLIDAGTRLVMFLDYDANTSVVPYILPEFDYFFETAYDVTDFDSCALDRPPGSNGAGLMMIVNHFLDVDIFGISIPDVAEDSSTNAATGSKSIGAQADLCISTWGRSPNLILLDNFNIGGYYLPLPAVVVHLLIMNRRCIYGARYSESSLGSDLIYHWIT